MANKMNILCLTCGDKYINMSCYDCHIYPELMGFKNDYENMIGSIEMEYVNIGIVNYYCCEESYYEIFKVPLNKITDETHILLNKYTNEFNNDEYDIYHENPFWELLYGTNNKELFKNTLDDYNKCTYKLTRTNCRFNTHKK